MRCQKVLKRLKSSANPEAVAAMAQFGINPRNTYGVSMPALMKMAREIGRDHRLAQELWSSDIHEARTLAAMIDDPASVTEKQIESWVRDFDSWDVVDQCCNRLFRRTEFPRRKAAEWTSRKEEFVKRAGFVLMACLAVHDKDADDAQFLRFLTIIRRESTDERNFVKKAVNWALRQIGKRNLSLHREAVRTAREIRALDSKAARWIASDALRELTSEKTVARVRSKQRTKPSSSKRQNGSHRAPKSPLAQGTSRTARHQRRRLRTEARATR